MENKSKAPVCLGFVDEFVTEKYKKQVDFTTNKAGGSPNFPDVSGVHNPNCTLCDQIKPLVVQIYAPLENSDFHRTLYLFGCVNPQCSGSNGSWTCIRVQFPNKNKKVEENKTLALVKTIDWGTGDADDWGTEDSLDFGVPDDFKISKNFEKMHLDEENITENEPTKKIDNEKTTSEDQKLQVVASTSKKISPNIEFVSFFISVWEEESCCSQDMDDSHIKALLQKYKEQNEQINLKTEINSNPNENFDENYEKSVPAHGDKFFQKFLSKIQENPGQILRYHREGSPLLIENLDGLPKKCEYCNGTRVFEFQILPTIISKLKLTNLDEEDCYALDFGTILVFTCKNSCWTENNHFRVENVILQMEQ